MSSSDQRGKTPRKSTRVRALEDRQEAGFEPHTETRPREVSLPPAGMVPSELDLAFQRTEVVDPESLGPDFYAAVRKKSGTPPADTGPGPAPQKSPTGSVKFNPTRVNAVASDALASAVDPSTGNSVGDLDDQRTEYIDPRALAAAAAADRRGPPSEPILDEIVRPPPPPPEDNPFGDADPTANDIGQAATSEWDVPDTKQRPLWLADAKRIDLPRPNGAPGEDAGFPQPPPTPANASGPMPPVAFDPNAATTLRRERSMRNFVRGVREDPANLPWGKLVAAGIVVFIAAFVLALSLKACLDTPADKPVSKETALEEEVSAREALDKKKARDEAEKEADNDKALAADADEDADENEDDDEDAPARGEPTGERATLRLSLVDDISGSGYSNLDTVLKKQMMRTLKQGRYFRATTRASKGTDDEGLQASLWIKGAKVTTTDDVARATVECSMAVSGFEAGGARMFKTESAAETELPLVEMDGAAEDDPAYQRAVQKAEGRLAGRAVSRCGEELSKQLGRHYEQRATGADAP